MRNKQSVIFIAIIIAVVILASLPFLKSGLFKIHDDQHIARLFLYDKALKDGQFPPRMVDGLGFGLGYPLFIFYPPLVYMVGEAFHLVGFGFINSIKLVFISSIVLSAFAMYICAKELYGKLPATVSAIFYILAPYRALDIYVRGALAESFAFVWPPFIIWSFYRLYKTGRLSYLLSSAVFLALLAITHNLILIPFLTIFPIYVVFLILIAREKKYLIVKFVSACVFAACLSAFFWLPALIEKKYTLVDQLLLKGLADYRIHFVYIQQLWNWTWGFGGSALGLADGISFKVGKLHIILSMISLALGFISLLKFHDKKHLKYSLFPILFATLLVVSAFMSLNYSQPAWSYFQPLGYLQFPWRFLLFTALFSSLLAGNFIFQLKYATLKVALSIITVATLLYFNIKLFKPQEYRFNQQDQQETSYEHMAWDVSQTSFEYLPYGTSIHEIESGGYLPDISKSDIFKESAYPIEGAAKIEGLNRDTVNLNFKTVSQVDTTIQINRANFPGWQVTMDGEKIPTYDNNSLKLITAIIPPGIHTINVSFKNTIIITVANSISIITLLAMAFIYIRYARRH